MLAYGTQWYDTFLRILTATSEQCNWARYTSQNHPFLWDT